MSGSAALSATIDEMTISTSTLAMTSSQIRFRFDRAAISASISWSVRGRVSTMSSLFGGRDRCLDVKRD